VLNNAAIMADTSSAPAASTPDVGVIATAFAAPSEEAIFAKSEAAAARYSGAAIRYDICTSHTGREIDALATKDAIEIREDILGFAKIRIVALSRMLLAHPGFRPETAAR
jgi:hypothetical protein